MVIRKILLGDKVNRYSVSRHFLTFFLDLLNLLFSLVSGLFILLSFLSSGLLILLSFLSSALFIILLLL